MCTEGARLGPMANETDFDGLMDIYSASIYLGVSVKTLRRRIDDGSLVAYRIKRSKDLERPILRFKRADVEALLERVPPKETKA